MKSCFLSHEHKEKIVDFQNINFSISLSSSWSFTRKSHEDSSHKRITKSYNRILITMNPWAISCIDFFVSLIKASVHDQNDEKLILVHNLHSLGAVSRDENKEQACETMENEITRDSRRDKNSRPARIHDFMEDRRFQDYEGEDVKITIDHELLRHQRLHISITILNLLSCKRLFNW